VCDSGILEDIEILTLMLCYPQVDSCVKKEDRVAQCGSERWLIMTKMPFVCTGKERFEFR
jgi:hypothetical protein